MRLGAPLLLAQHPIAPGRENKFRLADLCGRDRQRSAPRRSGSRTSSGGRSTPWRRPARGGRAELAEANAPGCRAIRTPTRTRGRCRRRIRRRTSGG